MNEPLGPDDELAALFREEAAEHVFSDALRAAVLRGVEHAVLLSPAAMAGAAGVAAVKAWTTKAVIALAALSFGVGAVAGVVGTKAIARRSAVEASTSSRSVAPPSTDAALAPAIPVTIPTDVPSTPPLVPSVRQGDLQRTAPVPAASARTESSPSTLARESELIETGRAALARGRSADALAATEEHRRLFPRGRLTEEREELAIRALRAAGRTDEARARAKAFLRAYPSSIYASTVEEAAR